MHACSKCGCTVFTLEGPKQSHFGGVKINTGMKLATCMECGSQDRPVDVHIKEVKDQHDTWLAMKRQREEEERYRCQPYQLLLAEWLKEFNKYSGAGNNEWDKQYKRDIDGEWDRYRLGKGDKPR